MALDPTKWLLTPSAAKDGKPWGAATNMAGRAKTAGSVPWDQGCRVTTLIGGYAAMSKMRDALESVIDDAKAPGSPPPGQRGHVYIADWRFNCQRDLSSENPWETHRWSIGQLAQHKDQTALGLVLRLMQAGVVVRILVWLPTPIQAAAADITAHILDHVYLARVVAEQNKRLNNPGIPLGIVGLDGRTTDGAIAGSHHQKMMVIRSPGKNVAFCGGVDLAFTRRDAPGSIWNYSKETVLDGDWQSGTMPDLNPLFPPGIIWPPGVPINNYMSAAKVPPPNVILPSDLPKDTNVKEVCDAMEGKWDAASQTCTYTTNSGDSRTKKPIYGEANQIWHDQHLMLEGPIVASLEWQFAERWIDSPAPFDPEKPQFDPDNVLKLVDWGRGDVHFSSPDALTSTTPPSIVHLNDPNDQPVVPGATSIVQMWRTIPMRKRISQLFQDGEFTVMAGFSKAMTAAQELIWIFDQYFWSEPAARLLNYQVRMTNVCVIVILPPYADGAFPEVHRARKFALAELTRDLNAEQRDRIAIYNMWHPASGRGIYVHAKTHTYDSSLLVCGSANMNRRSLTCDSELVCAVLDPDVVKAHQTKLWNLLFGKVVSPDGNWPNLDLNVIGIGNGIKFLEKFKAAAKSSDAFVIPDPWDDDNPLLTTPKTIVELPNGVPRPEAFQGPKYETMYDLALDPGSLDPTVENDIVDATRVPRHVRLDEIVSLIEKPSFLIPGSFPFYPNRKQAFIGSGQLIKLAGTTYSDGKYDFTETAEWFKQVCIGFPCFLPIGWPGYETAVIDNLTIDAHDVVLQLWKGWCPRFAGIKGMPGGVGAEVGVYRRIPGRLQEFLRQPGIKDLLALRFGQPRADFLLALLAAVLDQNRDVWWPFPELEVTVEFTLRNPTTGAVFFNSKPERTYWNCKWMMPDDYIKYSDIAANNAPVNTSLTNDINATIAFIKGLSPSSLFSQLDAWFGGLTRDAKDILSTSQKLLSTSQYVLDYKVTGNTSVAGIRSNYSGTWSWLTGPEQFPKIKI